MRSHAALILTAALLTPGLEASAQEPARGRGAAPRVTRPPLFFHEEWKQTAAGGEHPVNPAEALSNTNLELKLYGKDVLLTGSAQDENNPIHVWTCTCATPCAVALRDRNNYGDLTG